MRILRAPLLVLVFALATGCATSTPKWTPPSDSVFAKPITLMQAVTLAQTEDLRVAEWTARHRLAKSAVRRAWLPPNPTASYGWEDVGLKDALGNSLTATTYGASYPVLFWITRPWEIAAARHRRKAEEAAILAEKRDLAAEVGASWFEIAALSKKEKLAKATVGDAEEALRFAQTRLSVGESSALDVDRADAELLRAKCDLSDAVSAKRASQLAFAFALGADHPLYPDVDDSVDADFGASPMEPGKAIVESSPDVLAAQQEALAAGNDLTTQYLRILPLADAQGSASRKNGPEGMSSAYSIDVPIPLFDWNQEGIASARAQRLLAQVASERRRREATLKLSSTFDQWTAARDKYVGLALPLRDRSAKLGVAGRELFVQGQMEYGEFLQLRRDVVADSVSAVDAWMDARTAEWRLLCLVGDATSWRAESGEQRRPSPASHE